jgi:hypothetical protein
MAFGIVGREVELGSIHAFIGCMQNDYTAGQGLVDAGDDMVHMVKNNGNVAARTIAVQFLPAGATRRIDMPDLGNCHP